MKKKLIIIMTIILLSLDWAALDDITTGHESSFLAEYLILLLSIPIFVFIIYTFYSESLRRNSRKAIFINSCDTYEAFAKTTLLNLLSVQSPS